MNGRNGDADVENGLMEQLGRESGVNREGSINIYTLSCLKWIAGEKLLHNTGSPVWCSVITKRMGHEVKVGSR